MTKDNELYELDDRELAEMIHSRVCKLCKHFSIVRSIDSGKHVCDAFPDGIPDEIWQGDNNHSKPYQGDHGIQFEQSYKAE
jgi:molybdopterin-guanine dinucleotide biosynthesis protein A